MFTMLFHINIHIYKYIHRNTGCNNWERNIYWLIKRVNTGLQKKINRNKVTRNGNRFSWKPFPKIVFILKNNNNKRKMCEIRERHFK